MLCKYPNELVHARPLLLYGKVVSVVLQFENGVSSITKVLVYSDYCLEAISSLVHESSLHIMYTLAVYAGNS